MATLRPSKMHSLPFSMRLLVNWVTKMVVSSSEIIRLSHTTVSLSTFRSFVLRSPTLALISLYFERTLRFADRRSRSVTYAVWRICSEGHELNLQFAGPDKRRPAPARLSRVADEERIRVQSAVRRPARTGQYVPVHGWVWCIMRMQIVAWKIAVFAKCTFRISCNSKYHASFRVYETHLTIVEPVLRSVHGRDPDSIAVHAGFYPWGARMPIHLWVSNREKVWTCVHVKRFSCCFTAS